MKDLNVEGPISEMSFAYHSARTEIIERIKLRDQNLIAYLAAVGTVLGFAFGNVGNRITDTQLISAAALPLICMIFTAIISTHHIVIGKIGEYIVSELNVKTPIDCWDTSQTSNNAWNSQFPAHLVSFRY